jgi:hypothetical protein
MQPKLQFLNLSDRAPLTRIRLSFRQTSDIPFRVCSLFKKSFYINNYLLIDVTMALATRGGIT